MTTQEIKISKEGSRLVLEIPQGMTGSQLNRWKAKNKKLIEAAKEAPAGQYAVVSIEEESTLPTSTPVSKKTEQEMFHEEHSDYLTNKEAFDYLNQIVTEAGYKPISKADFNKVLSEVNTGSYTHRYTETEIEDIAAEYIQEHSF